MNTNPRRHSVRNPAPSVSRLQASSPSSSSAPHHYQVQHQHHTPPHQHHHHHHHIHHHVAPASLPHLLPPDTHNPHLENPENSDEACLCATCHLRTRFFPRRQDGRIVLPHPWLVASPVQAEGVEGQSLRRRAATVSAVDHTQRRSEREMFLSSDSSHAESGLTGTLSRPGDDASTRLHPVMRPSHTSTEPVNDPDHMPHGKNDPNRHHHSRIGSIRSRTASTPKPYDLPPKKPDPWPRSSNVEASSSSRTARPPSRSFSSHVRPSLHGMEPIPASPESPPTPQNPIPDRSPRQMGAREFVGTYVARYNTDDLESHSAFVDDRGLIAPTPSYPLPDISVHSLPPVASSSSFADNNNNNPINIANIDNNLRRSQTPMQSQSRQIRFNPRHENPQPLASSSSGPLLGPGGQFVNTIGIDVDERLRGAPNRLPTGASPELNPRRGGKHTSSSATTPARIRFQSPVIHDASLITPIDSLSPPATSTSVNPTSSPTQPKELSIIQVKWDSDRKRRQGYFAQSQEEGEEKSPFRHYNKSECDFDR